VDVGEDKIEEDRGEEGGWSAEEKLIEPVPALCASSGKEAAMDCGRE